MFRIFYQDRCLVCRLWTLGVIAVCGVLVFGGCALGPTRIPTASQKTIDRKYVEYPPGFGLKAVAKNLTAPVAIAFVKDEGEYKGALLVAESGEGGHSPRIYGWKVDGTYFSIYPRPTRLPTFGLIKRGPDLEAPIGGMVVFQNRVFVTHRDKNSRGVITSFGFDGSWMTIAADLPAQGDYSLTDIVVNPTTGRLWFALGSATNSGVVGLDNFLVGWVRRFPKFCDLAGQDLKLLGLKFFTRNPDGGLFGGDDNVGTGPYQWFGKNNLLRIHKPTNDKPTGAVYSASPLGGDLRVEAWGLHHVRGLGFDDYSNLFATNDGMELRGTRPIKDDPDAMIKITENTYYGGPDFSTDMLPISSPRFQPDSELVLKAGAYPEITPLIDLAASGLTSPTNFRTSLLYGAFPSLSGAAKFDFAPPTQDYRNYSNSALVALSGDRAPFATGGQKLKSPVGYQVARVDLISKRIEPFIRNTLELPASLLGRGAIGLERPVDVKLGPDGKIYVLDFGKMEMRGGKEKIPRWSGQIFVLDPVRAPTTRSATGN